MLQEHETLGPLKLFEVVENGHALNFYVRCGTSDADAIQDVLGSHSYSYARSMLSQDAVVIDVGAHIGTFSLLAAAHGARVFSLEPIPANYTVLEENVQMNHFQSQVKTFNIAAWSADGERMMPVADDNTGGSGFYYDKASVPKVKVHCLCLDTLMDDLGVAKCDWLKLDCEGAEFEILRALSERAWQRIGAIVMEYHLFADYTLDELQDLLVAQGFLISTQPDGVLGYIVAVRPPVPLPSFSPVPLLGLNLAASPLDGFPLVGSLWRVIRREAHRLVVFYINQFISAYNKQQGQIEIYLRLLGQKFMRE